MIDADVVRLRQMRNVALRARALARALNSDSAIDRAVFARCAVTFWGIARVASGRLRAHPYLNYQKGPSLIRELADRAGASIAAFSAHRRRRSLSALALELQCVAHEVDDARALTRLPDLSDSLGRRQLQLRRLAKELDARAQSQLGADAMPGINALVCVDADGDTLHALAVQNDWPYLAI
jgi:hypothetical protein